MARRGGASGVAAALAGLLAAASMLVAGTLPARAATGDIGYPGWSTAGASQPPSSDKPESKLWFAQGRWWGVLWSRATARYTIAALDRSAHAWTDTGTAVDTRAGTLADALWDGVHLYVASHVATVSSEANPVASRADQPARLMRYTYDPTSARYTLDAGFPTRISNSSSESLTIDEDSSGRIWATWTQVSAAGSRFTSAVYTNVSAVAGTSWATPARLPAPGATVSPDDISSVASFAGDRIAVVWGNQRDGNVYWATRTDSQPVTSWTTAVVAGGRSFADDHVSLRSLQADPSGRLFVVVKTGLDATGSGSAAQVVLLTFTSGAWTSSPVWTVADCPTRPIAMLDQEHQVIHVIATAPGTGCPYSGAAGSIVEKTAPLARPVFAAGRGTPVIRDALSAHLNDVTSTKQAVTGTTGLVLLATNQTTHVYWYNDLALR